MIQCTGQARRIADDQAVAEQSINVHVTSLSGHQ